MGQPDGRASSAGSAAGRFLRSFLVLFVIVGLGGAVAYLLSERNHRQYRLRADEGMLIVERGRFLPVGFEVFSPNSTSLRAAYAPIPLPPGEGFDASEVYDDRADLDRALFGILAAWSRARLDARDPTELDLAMTYLERTELLPGLSEEQRAELRTLRADSAYRRGRRMLSEVVERLQIAKQELQLSLDLGTSRAEDARRWLEEVNRRIAAYEQNKGAQPLGADDYALPGGSTHEPQSPGSSRGPTTGPALPKNDRSGGIEQERWRL